MVLILNGPIWFRGFESLFVFVAGLIMLLVATLSYKAYKLSSEERYKYSGIAFGCMSASFLLMSLVNGLLVLHVLDDTITNLITKFDFIFFIHMLLMLVAYTILLMVTLKIENKEVMTLLMALVLLFVLFSYQYYLKFHMVSFILLFFLSYQFYTNYLEKKLKNAYLVFAAFYLLTAAEALAVLMVFTDQTVYILSRVVQFVGYLVLFYAFLSVVNHGRKKRKA